MVSIDAFQALDPGSIPGHRTLLTPKSRDFQLQELFHRTYYSKITLRNRLDQNHGMIFMKMIIKIYRTVESA